MTESYKFWTWSTFQKTSFRAARNWHFIYHNFHVHKIFDVSLNHPFAARGARTKIISWNLWAWCNGLCINNKFQLNFFQFYDLLFICILVSEILSSDNQYKKQDITLKAKVSENLKLRYILKLLTLPRSSH